MIYLQTRQANGSIKRIPIRLSYFGIAQLLWVDGAL